MAQSTVLAPTDRNPATATARTKPLCHRKHAAWQHGNGILQAGRARASRRPEQRNHRSPLRTSAKSWPDLDVAPLRKAAAWRAQELVGAGGGPLAPRITARGLASLWPEDSPDLTASGRNDLFRNRISMHDSPFETRPDDYPRICNCASKTGAEVGFPLPRNSSISPASHIFA